MNRLCQKKLFTQIHKHTTNWNQPQLPAQWGSMVKSRGVWFSFWAGCWSEAQHKHIKISPQVHQHSVGYPQNNVSPPPISQPQHLLPSVFFIAGCWHKLPIRLQYKLPAVSGTVFLSAVNLWPKPRLITLRSYLHCHVSHSSFCLGLVCNVLLIMTESLSPWSRQSFMLLCKNEGHFLYTSSQSKLVVYKILG